MWVERIDALKQQLGLTSDAALARRLGVTPQYLSDVRKGGKPASPLLKFRILDLSAYVWTEDTVLDLLPEELKDAVAAKLHAIQARGDGPPDEPA